MKRTGYEHQVESTSSKTLIDSSESGSTEPDNNSRSPEVKNKLPAQNLNLNQSMDQNAGIEAKKAKMTVNLENDLTQLEDPPVTEEEKNVSAEKMVYAFFDAPCKELAKKLLGKILVRRLDNGTILKGRIVETEAYLGEIDKASQIYQRKVTPNELPMNVSSGTIYVYLVNGMHHCFSIASSGGKGCVVLIRAVEPMEGVEEMEKFWNSHRLQFGQQPLSSIQYQKNQLCNGPSKVCIAFQIDESHSKYAIWYYKKLWIESDDSRDLKIVQSARIGIDSAGPEWASKLLRYYVYSNTSVSRKDNEAEDKLLNIDHCTFFNDLL